MFNDSNSFELALVSAVEAGLSVSLPIAAGVTTSFLIGCHSVQDYLGLFVTKTVAGTSFNKGVTSLNPLTSRRTGCNTLTVNTGSSTQIVGVSTSKWMLRSPKYRVSGAGVNRLIRFMTDGSMSRQRLHCN